MPDYTAGVLLAVASTVTFTAMSLWSRVMQDREGPIRFIFYFALAPGIIALASWPLRMPDLGNWDLVRSVLIIAPFVLAGSFFLGLAFRYGEISYVAPVYGSKPLIVMGLALVLGIETPSPSMWAAGGLLLVALFILNGSRDVLRRPWTVFKPVVLLVLASGALYSLADLLTRQYVAEYDLPVWEFLSASWVIRGAMAGILLLGYARVLRREHVLPRKLSTLAVMGPILVVHGICFVGALKLTDSAILVNVISSLRGIVGIGAVTLMAWMNVGRYERLTREVTLIRVIGALLVCVAVYLGLAAR